MKRILLIEDDVQLNEMLTMELKQHPYSIDSCLNGNDGFCRASQNNYDLIILDRILPDTEGVSLLKKMRDNGISSPVLVLTALDSLQNKIDGFEAGADDYLTKPFHMEELLLRMTALLRRPISLQDDSSLSCFDLSLDNTRYTLNCGGRNVALTKTQFRLMGLFMKNPSKIFSREELLACIWGSHTEVEPANVDNYIYFLRRHLKTLKSSTAIHTVYGIGYTLAGNTGRGNSRND